MADRAEEDGFESRQFADDIFGQDLAGAEVSFAA